jgi:hypothetical protein
VPATCLRRSAREGDKATSLVYLHRGFVFQAEDLVPVFSGEVRPHLSLIGDAEADLNELPLVLEHVYEAKVATSFSFHAGIGIVDEV